MLSTTTVKKPIPIVMTHRPLSAAIVMAALLSAAFSAQGAPVQSNTTYTAYGDLPVSNSDLVNHGQATLASYTVSATSDSDETPDRGFITGTAGSSFSDITWFRDDGANDQLPATLTLNLDVSANTAGYDISQINSYAGYIAGLEQGDQIMTVEYSLIGDAGFTTLGTYSYEDPAVDEFSRISLSDDTAPYLLSGVDALRVTYADPATADLLVLQEIDVLGTASPQGGIVQSNSTYTAYGDLPVSNSDLVNYGQPTLASYTVSATSDSDETPDRGFITGTAAGTFPAITWFRDDNSNDQLPATLTLNLDVNVNTAGYDISQINSYAGYIAGLEQGDQIMTVEYSLVGEAGFTTLGTYSYEDPAVDEFSRISLSHGTDAYLLSGVDALRFTYADPATADLLVLQEIDVLGTTTPNGVNLTSYPTSLHFYARDTGQMHVSLPVVGNVETDDITGLFLRTFTNGVQYGIDQAVGYTSTGSTYNFSTTVNLPSLLAKVDVQLIKTKADNSEVILASSTDITVGDVYLIQGQSNADAASYGESANAFVSPYILTYGNNTDDPVTLQNSLGWQQAQGNGSLNQTGGIGQWGLKMAHELVNTHQIPLAIFNGADPGKAIAFFQRDDADHDNLTTNYGRLYHRVDQAGLRDKVRGLLYYQGESDFNNATQWLNGWNPLYADWQENYPNIEHYYLVQVREGCGVGRFSIALRDAQRLLQEQDSDITVLSPLGVDTHDGCHYDFVGGYESLGVRYAKLLGRDFYGATDDPNIETIYPVFAELIGASNDQIRIAVKRPQAAITFQSGAETDFLLSGTSVTVQSGSYANGFLTLQLSGNATGVTDLIYGGRARAGQWVITSQNNSLLAFSEPVTAYQDSDNDGLSDNEETQLTSTNPNLADTDGDGTTDKEELTLGLDPNDPQSRFASCLASNGTLLTWPSQEGLSFKLYYSQDLQGSFSTWPSISLTDNDGDQADIFQYDLTGLPSSEKYFFVIELLTTP